MTNPDSNTDPLVHTNPFRWRLEGATIVYAIQMAYIGITGNTISVELMFITFVELLSVPIICDVFNMVKFWHKN